MQLYDYFRSTAAYRVRIVLNLKGLAYETRVVNLLKSEGRESEYLQQNPQGLVPALALDDGSCLSQSLAICEYLEEEYPTPALLPGDPLQRAKVRSFAQTIACDIHPLNNLRVLKYLTGTLGIDEDAKLGWYRHWVAEGFGALEAKVGGDTDFCFGSNPTLADVFLVAQMFNARRFECDLEAYPKLVGITDRCEDIDAFRRAHPDHSAK